MQRDQLALVSGPALGAVAGLAVYAAGLGTDAAITAGVTAICATWWVLEPIHIAATSLIPFAVFPLTGVVKHGEVAKAYGHTLILLLLGGFILSAAVEKSGAHRRIALGMVRLTGGRDRRLILGAGDADDPGGAVGQLRLHAPGGDRAQRHHVRHRADHHGDHGARGLWPQPGGRSNHYGRLCISCSTSVTV